MASAKPRIEPVEALFGGRAITIRGAREHNLKNVDLAIPRDRLVVFTGLSGSGKSSLAFDTIYAEGQRRYVESLSAYARQFLEMMQKPDLDQIDGLSPAIAIEQKTTSKNPRSTVGTVTEIHDYMRLLWARVGVPYSPATGLPIESQTVSQMVDRVLSLPQGARLYLTAPVVRGRKGEYRKEIADYMKRGFQRLKVDGAFYEIADAPALDKKIKHDIEVVVDRIVVRPDMAARLAESFETALELADGLAVVEFADAPASPSPLPRQARDEARQARDEARQARDEARQARDEGGERGREGERERILFSSKFACPVSGFTIAEIEPRLFSFNSPHGACPVCGGLGSELRVDPSLVVPDPKMTLKRGAIAPWAKSSSPYYQQTLDALARHYRFRLDKPWGDLPEAARKAILYGSGEEEIRFAYDDGLRSYEVRKPFEGVVSNLERRYRETESEWSREEIQRYMSATPCEACNGFRLKPEALAVKIDGQHIGEVSLLSVKAAVDWAEGLPQKLDAKRNEIAHRILKEIVDRLAFLRDVGLDYLTLARSSGTLSGGESQRIRLASQIGSGLTGVLYVLDEPSIGLHQRDNARLLDTLRRLRNLGNTVIVVEHDEDAIWAADYVVDVGPGAGVHGGEIVAKGTPAEIAAAPEFPDRALSLGRAHGRDPGAAPRAEAGQGAQDRRGARQQPEAHRGVGAARTLHLRHRRLGRGQIDPRHRHALQGRGAASERRERPAGAPRSDRGPRRARQGDRHRPVADRPHAALEPGDLHGRLHAHPRLVRRSARGQGARLPAGPLLVQRQGRAVRGLPGRRRHQDRDALSARRLRHLRHLQGQAL